MSPARELSPSADTSCAAFAQITPDLIVTAHADGAALLQAWIDPDTGFQLHTRTVDVFPTIWGAQEARNTANAAAAELTACLSRNI